MKKLSVIALFVAVTTFSLHSSNAVENQAAEETLAIVCVDWRVEGAGPNIAYFYTRACAETFQSLNGGTVIKGNVCVNDTQVFICL